MHPLIATILLSPRFGLPAIEQVGRAFPIETTATRAFLLDTTLSDEDAARCADGAVVVGCIALVLTSGHAQPMEAVPQGAYDLYAQGERAKKAVWYRDEDPRVVRPLNVIAMSDLHVGKSKTIERRLKETIAEINALAPDLVLVSGDVADDGENAEMEARAAKMLHALESPVFVMPGNHDLSFGPRALVHGAYKVGWPNFARAFHPALFAQMELHGWRFVGFDSGASEYTPFNHTQGLSADALQKIEAAVASADRGVFLFSHAPSRARMTVGCAPFASGPFGKMRRGGRELEALLLRAAPRSIYLAGHTHWGDLFAQEDAAFRQTKLGDGTLHAHATMVNVQSATHHGYFRESAKGWGFARFVLGDQDPRMTLSRHGL